MKTINTLIHLVHQQIVLSQLKKRIGVFGLFFYNLNKCLQVSFFFVLNCGFVLVLAQVLNDDRAPGSSEAGFFQGGGNLLVDFPLEAHRGQIPEQAGI